MAGLRTAARYLTIVPLPGGADGGVDRLGRAAGWFPVVGLGLGVVLAGLDRAASVVFPSLLTAVLVVTAWKLLTGGLHLDGLADCLDGLGGDGRDDRLRIMRDSHIGVFGAVGLILILFLGLAALADLPSDFRRRALLAAPTIGRAAPPLLARLLPAARGAGQGATFARAVRAPEASVAALFALAIAVLGLGGAGAAAWAGGLAVAVAASRFLARRRGGLTGDVFGASVEIAEVAVLLVLAAVAGLGR